MKKRRRRRRKTHVNPFPNKRASVHGGARHNESTRATGTTGHGGHLTPGSLGNLSRNPHCILMHRGGAPWLHGPQTFLERRTSASPDGHFLVDYLKDEASDQRVTTTSSFHQICGTPALHRKNLGATGPEKFTAEFIQKQVEEFEIGKRHLANMMGEDPENFTQEDIDRSIAYLFPSGLFEKSARPLMKHPVEIFPKQRAVQWGPDGRPFHFLFYTGKQSYYSLMHDLYGRVLKVEKHQDQLRAKGLFPTEPKQIALGTSRWLTKEELEALLVEPISSQDYECFIQLMERLLTMPCCSLEQQFVMNHRRQLEAQSMHQVVPPLQKDDAGVDFSTAEGRRKTSKGSVVVRDCGAGRLTVNGQDYLHYFSVLQDREQLMFPLQFCGLLGRFDLDCSVSGGGRSSQAGALRLAISRALLSFLSQSEGEAMRQAGLLTPDPRVRERKKPGQEGARRKFTWKKR